MSKFQIIFFSIIAAFLVAEVYCYNGLSQTFKGTGFAKFYPYVYVLTVILPLIGFGIMMARSGDRSNYNALRDNLWMGLAFSFIVFKITMALFLAVGDSLRFFEWVGVKIANLSGSNVEGGYLASRRNFMGAIALGLASIPFVSMIYGITKGKYNYKVRKVVLSFKDLPKSFDGYRITQFSDFHAGSFDDYESLEYGIKLMDDQNSDMILFTGDLVNDMAREVDPFISFLNQMTAKDGKFSVLGNHDYGEYVRWSSQQAKVDNFNQLKANHKRMGFDLLLNENRIIERNGEKISLVGVENWGRQPFPQYGDLDLALTNTDEAPFTVLMSHDPSHWSDVAKDHDRHVHLTLSGHTHGMQFGVEIPGFKWSPVKYRYKNWAGLYEEAKQYLYVNRGFGFIGFPGRVGIFPEITVIELKRA